MTSYLFQRPEFYADPYPYYRVLLEHRPVSREVIAPGGALVKYDDITKALRDPHFSSVRVPNDAPIPDLGVATCEVEAARRFRNRWILQMDAPEHDTLRDSVRREFTPRAIEALSPTVAGIVDDVFSRLEGHDELDFVSDVTAPLVGMSLCAAMGVPTQDWRKLRSWADHIVGMTSPNLSETEQWALAHQAVWDMKSYAEHLLAQSNGFAAPISAVVDAARSGSLLCEDALGMVVLLLSAGHHSTVHAICNGVNALLNDPPTREQFQSGDLSMILAIEELLRFDSAVGLLSRRLTDDIAIRGVKLSKGTTVALAMGAANRDPEMFDDPDRLNLARKVNPHLSFGLGSHYCLGAALSRLIFALTLPRVFARFPEIALGSRPAEWTPRRMNHGPISLPVRLGRPL